MGEIWVGTGHGLMQVRNDIASLLQVSSDELDERARNISKQLHVNVRTANNAIAGFVDC